MSPKKKVLITFLGNINYDTRCRNLFDTLSSNGFDVEFFGFDWLTDGFTETRGNISIIKLKKGFLSVPFYLKFLWYSKLKLLSGKAAIIFAEDIYTLPLAVIFGKLKSAKVFYDSRELFGHLAGLKDKKFRQYFWRWIEKLFIIKADLVIVTGKMDEDFLRKKYHLRNTLVIRNLPRYYKTPVHFDFYQNLKIQKSKKIILYQGVLLKGRGIEKVFNALKQLPEHVFIIAGSGEFEAYYKKLAYEMELGDQVFFMGKFAQDELPKITASAHTGVAIIENMSLSYYYALPNKLFEYIMAEVPVIVSNLPQMKEIIEKYNVGISVDADNTAELIDAIKKLTEDENFYESKKLNCRLASQELNWENEVTTLLKSLND